MDSYQIFQSIQAIVTGDSSQIEIAPLLWEHQCYYLLSLLQDNSYTVMLRNKKFFNQQTVLARLEVCKELFEMIKFPYAVVKGAILSIRAYQNIATRSSGDIDILIRDTDIKKFSVLLQKFGFQQGYIKNMEIIPYSRREIIFYEMYTHQTAPFVKKTESFFCPFINIDINTNVYWGGALENINMSTILNEKEKIALPHLGSVYCLKPEMEFICLCLHHYKDLNSIFLLYSRKIKLSLFCDIFFYLKNNQLDREKLLFLSKTLHAGKYIYYCLFFCNQIFNSKILQEYLILFSPFRENCLQSGFGLGEERHIWQIPFEERLFSKNLRKEMIPLLSAKEREDIQTNLQFIH